MTAKEILVAARKRIEKPENWCQGTFARKADGSGCSLLHHLACQWCAGGAVAATRVGKWRDTVGATMLLHSEAARLGGFASLEALNDKTDHDTVMKMFDNAIARAA